MSSAPIDSGHPVLQFARALNDRLEKLVATPMWSMTPAEQREALRELARAEAQLTGMRLRVLGEADRSGAGLDRGAPSAAEWVAAETRQTRISARSDLKLAKALEGYPVLAAALDRGRVNLEQARVITTALDRLPTSGEFAVTTAQREQAEIHLVELAKLHDAKALARLGTRIFEVIAPEMADAYDGKVLAEQEARAARKVTLTMREDTDGTCHGWFRIPTFHGQALKKMILALCSPARHTATDIEEHLPTEVRHGHALCQLIEAVPGKSLPKAGGVGATIVVTMTLDQLLADLHTAGACDLDTGGRITAAQARRLACTAGIIPAVLGGRSEVLDLGRERRSYSRAQRVAMMLRDGHCTAQDCEQPPALCHAHHDHPWSMGGPTDLRHGRLLCGHHHRRIHDPRYATTHHPNGTVSFHRRT